MSVTATVEKGEIKLPVDVEWPTGARVRVELLDAEATEPAAVLPDDLAANHDYYLHGLPKREPRRGRWMPASAARPELTEAEAAASTDELLKLAAEVRNLPPDLSARHDEYRRNR